MLSHVWLCHCIDCSMPGSSVLHCLPEFAQTPVHWVSDAIQPSHPLSSLSPSAFKFSRIRVFSNESVLCIRWPKYSSFSFGISPSNEYSGLISFRMDWLDLLAVQGTLKSLLQHHSSIKIKWVNIFTLCLLISFFSKEDKCFFFNLINERSFFFPILTLYMLPFLYSCDLSHLSR